MGLLELEGKRDLQWEMGWIGRELKDCLVPTSLPWAENLPVGQVTQNPVQPGLEHLQG